MNDTRVTEWDSRSEMLDKLRGKHLLILESGTEGVCAYYQLDLPAGYDDLNRGDFFDWPPQAVSRMA